MPLPQTIQLSASAKSPSHISSFVCPETRLGLTRTSSFPVPVEQFVKKCDDCLRLAIFCNRESKILKVSNAETAAPRKEQSRQTSCMKTILIVDDDTELCSML